MMKFFKPDVEEKMMKKVLLPITSTFPGATYPLIDYPITKKKTEPVPATIPIPISAPAAVKKEETKPAEVKKETAEEGGKKKKKKKKSKA